MQARCDQCARDTLVLEGREIARVAHTPGRVERGVSGARADFAQSGEVRAGAAPDAGERHDDDTGRPDIRLSEQGWRPDKGIAAKVKREDGARIMLQAGNQGRVALCFAAEHEAAVGCIEETARCLRVRNAVVDPEFEFGISSFQPRQNRIAVAGSFDRIEIGDIEGPEWENRQQAAGHVERIACGCERRLDRTIKRALSQTRAHDLPSLQINDRNDFHADGDARYA